MLRSSAILLLNLIALSGCDHFLAKNNPCGGIYPADGVAEVYGAALAGNMTVQNAAATQSFAFTANPEDNVDCDTFVTGLAPDDGSGTINVQVQCAQTSISFTFPDVRTLTQGTQMSLPATVTLWDNSTIDSTATVRIDQAVGTKQPSPTFVSSDFLRAATITFDSCDADAGEDAGSSESCGVVSNVTVNAKVQFVASNYSQAETSGEDHCPDLPSK